MSHSKEEELEEIYNSVLDQVILIRDEVNSLYKKLRLGHLYIDTDKNTVHTALHVIKKRAAYAQKVLRNKI